MNKPTQQTQRVVSLLRGHRVRIARALVRQTRALVPRYEQLDTLAQERNFMSLLLGVERLLEFDDDAPLMEVAAHIAQLRASMGFRVEEFSVASLCFLPVVRRFVIEHATSLDVGLADYELFEAVALPVIGRAANLFLDANEEPTIPSGGFVALKPKPLRPIRIERVIGDDDEENTVTNLGLPFSVRSAL